MTNEKRSETQQGDPLTQVQPRTDAGKVVWIRCLMQVLWPAFGGAAVTVGLVFSLIDPLQIEWVQIYLNDSRQASYTLGFLIFWVLYSLACSLTWYLATTEAIHRNSRG